MQRRSTFYNTNVHIWCASACIVSRYRKLCSAGCAGFTLTRDCRIDSEVTVLADYLIVYWEVHAGIQESEYGSIHTEIRLNRVILVVVSVVDEEGDVVPSSLIGVIEEDGVVLCTTDTASRGWWQHGEPR